MTTLVMILNEGPDPVKVEVQGRDAKGHFSPVKEFVVPSGGFKREYVHATQSLQVIEQKEAPNG